MALKKFLKSFIQEEEGATAVEYAIMVALIAAVIVGAVALLGERTGALFTDVSNKVASM